MHDIYGVIDNMKISIEIWNTILVDDFCRYYNVLFNILRFKPFRCFYDAEYIVFNIYGTLLEIMISNTDFFKYVQLWYHLRFSPWIQSLETEPVFNWTQHTQFNQNQHLIHMSAKKTF